MPAIHTAAETEPGLAKTVLSTVNNSRVLNSVQASTNALIRSDSQDKRINVLNEA